MKKDSIETLLQRHYGNLAPAPVYLEKQLLASVSAETAKIREQQQQVALLREKRISRRQLLKRISLRSAGLELLSVGLDGLQSLEVALTSGDSSRSAYP
jgi:hypothetical protein